MGIFSILATPLGIVMRWLYLVIQNYGWTIIVFTFLVRILMFPLSIKQQKSTARMSAFQPMIQEIQKKWANDRNKQNVELQKFYEENNIKMSAGCAPMLVNMLVLFGIIAVIQSPLNYILQMNETETNTATAIVQFHDPDSDIGEGGSSYTRQSRLIDEIRNNPQLFVDGAEVPVVNGQSYILTGGQTYSDGKILDKDGKVVQEEASLEHRALLPEDVEKVQEFKFTFLGMNLAEAPNAAQWWTFIMPILSLLTMVASQVIIMRTSGQTQSKGQMWVMTIVMGVMFGFFAFTVPAGFSLYYTTSNVVMTLQQLILKRMYNPDKMREEIEAEIEARKAAKKAKKKVVVREASGELAEKELSEAELLKLRLAKARELDAARYKDDEADTNADNEAAEKARKLDEEKYGAAAPPTEDITDVEYTDVVEDADEAASKEDAASAEKDAASTEDEEKAPAASGDATGGKAEYKPGRRKRARQSKAKTPADDDAASFADKERESEEKSSPQDD